MKTKQLLLVGASVVTAALLGGAGAQDTQEQTDGQYVQVAEIEIDPTQLEAYKAAVREQIETAIRVEPGVLILYAVSEKDDPARIRVFEIYRNTDAYKSHLESAHFKKYKAKTEKMVKSLKLVKATPIMLGAKVR
jgi:quinol monooxygenase YgiN